MGAMFFTMHLNRDTKVRKNVSRFFSHYVVSVLAKNENEFQTHHNLRCYNSMEQVIQGCDVVIVTLIASDNAPTSLVSNTVKQVIQAMKKYNIKRIVLSSSTADVSSWIVRRFLLNYILNDLSRAEKLLEENSKWLDYTIVRQSGLQDDISRKIIECARDSSQIGSKTLIVETKKHIKFGEAAVLVPASTWIWYLTIATGVVAGTTVVGIYAYKNNLITRIREVGEAVLTGGR